MIKFEQTERLGWKLHVLIFLVVAVAIVTRRPDALLNPQFYAEDGAAWFGQAYSFGWLYSLTIPAGGYLNTLQRLAGSLALLVPFHFAPLVMNLVGLAMQALPVNVLLSSRMAGWGPLKMRALAAVFYVALPNSAEIDVTVTNAPFHLGLTACLLALSAPPVTLLGKVVDCAVLLVSGLSGPYGFVLTPVVAAFWWFRRQRWSLVCLGIALLTSAVQAFELLGAASAQRPVLELGAGPVLFLRILVGQVFLGAIVGGNTFGARCGLLTLLVLAALGSAVVAYCLLKSRLELKLFIVFCGAVMAMGLLRPLVTIGRPAWLRLVENAQMRYWFFPMLGFLFALAWCVTQENSSRLRLASAFLLPLAVIGIIRDWRYPAYSDGHFPDYARQFDESAPCTIVTIPTYPVGWPVRLVTKGRNCAFGAEGYIDAPAEGAKISPQGFSSGWVINTAGTKQVFLYVDGSLAKTVNTAYPRPDVDKAFPGYPDTKKGWATLLDISKLKAGKHELVVRALDNQGREAQIGRREFSN